MRLREAEAVQLASSHARIRIQTCPSPQPVFLPFNIPDSPQGLNEPVSPHIRPPVSVKTAPKLSPFLPVCDEDTCGQNLNQGQGHTSLFLRGCVTGEVGQSPLLTRFLTDPSSPLVS